MRGREIVVGCLVAGAVAALSGGAVAEQPAAEPLFVNYGTGASIRQGDNDHRQAIYLSVPAETTGPLFVRIFDPETAGHYDQIDRLGVTTQTRFSLFGGEGAFIPEPDDREALTEAELTAGTKLAEETYGRAWQTDGKWVTLATVDPAQGQLVGDRRVFRLVADALSGPNGNLYDVAISTRDDATAPPPGATMFSYTATIRMPRRGVLTELRFRAPDDDGGVTVGNFDAAFGEAYLTTPLAWYPLVSSGQGVMEETTISLPERDRGGTVAVTLSGGEEYPNDATFYVADSAGRLLPFELPPRLFALNQRPIARIDHEAPAVCGRTVRFSSARTSDAEGDPLDFTWRFGDGSSAAGADATHSYAEDGRYVATLEVRDPGPQLGSGSAATVSLFLKEPPVARSDKRLLVGAGEETTFDGRGSSASKWRVATHRWDFGDGTSAEGEAVNHAFAAPGTYSVTHTVIDDSGHPCDTAAETFTVRVNAAPVAEAGEDRRLAVGEPGQFDASASRDPDGSITAFAWSFGDGATAIGLNPTHAYLAPGTYTVTLSIRDDSDVANSGARDTLTVIVNDPPVPVAGADRRLAVGETTTLDGSASRDPDGTVTAHAWDFGDGTGATGAVVSHAYEAPGTYTVTLAATDDSGTPTATQRDTLTVIVNDPPVPEAGADRSVAIDEPITFDAAASLDPDGAITAYAWDFGDGSGAEGAVAEHAYERPGTYTVTLAVTDDSGTRTATQRDTLSVRVNDPPVAVAGPDQSVTASVVEFDGSASWDADDAIAAWSWDFGDGQSGEGPRPRHVYAEPGIYPVMLTVTDASGTIRNTSRDMVEIVVNARPIADAGPDAIGAPGEMLTFDGARSLDPDGSVVSWEWDFGDGSTALGALVRHAYAQPGTYAVRLTVRDDTGHAEAFDHAEASAFVNAPPVAEAGADVAVAPGETVALSAAASFDRDGTIGAYRWDFSDGDAPMMGPEVARSFAEPGIYTAQLTVTDDSGASNGVAVDSLRIAVNHAPVADAGPRIHTDATTVTLDGTRSLDADGDPLTYAWDFGDGSTGAGAIVTHTYAGGGIFPVVLTVDDGSGLANGTERIGLEVAINRAPVAVAGENRRVCTGDVVVLDASRSADPEGSVLRYAWDFGDGTGSDLVNPTKTYRRGGVYPVTLTVRDDAGLGNSSGIDRIAVQVDQGPVADAGADILACAVIPVAFDGSGSTDTDGVVNRFTWDFGDGNEGGGATPSHVYEQPGDYRVFLTIEGEQAGLCSATSRDEIGVRIVEGPVALIAAPEAVPLGETVSFDAGASHTDSGSITAYEWDFGDGTTATGAAVAHRYAAAGTYPVTLTLASDSPSPACRSVSARHVVRVNAPPVADAGADRTLAAGEEGVFDGLASRDPDGGIVAYEWDFGDGTTAAGASVRHRFGAPGTYYVRLTVADEAGLANSRAADTVTVTVNPAPAPAIAGPLVACAGVPETWSAPDGTGLSYRWILGDGAEATTPEATHAYGRPGRYGVVLVADDGRGEANSVVQSTAVVHVNQPPHAEAGPDQRACPGTPVVFDAGASRDADGALVGHAWDFGDGTSGEGATASHVFAAPGTYAVTLTVTDDSGSACAATTDTLTVVVNAAPVAEAGGDRTVFIGGANDAVLLDGTASSDPDGEALSHAWQIGGGDIESGARLRYPLSMPGDVPVTLTVSDTSGLDCGTASTSFVIRAVPR